MATVTERKGTIGVVKGSGDNEAFKAKANFCLQIVAKIEGINDGYVARVTRAPDGVTRDCFFMASSAMHKKEFIQAINAGFSSGGMFCSLSDGDLGNYLLEKVMDFMAKPSPRTLQAINNIGLQDVNPPIFVLSEELHLDDDGHLIDVESQNMFFQSHNIEAKLKPIISMPYQPSIQPLIDLWQAVEIVSQHNAGAALFTFGAVAMNMHFQQIVELKGGAPIVVLYGEPDVGKTTIANAAMSAIGIEACSFRGMRREYFAHLASKTSLGLMYDDPNKVFEVENIIIDFYNQMTRGSFKRGLETPRCGFLLACNFSLGKIQRLLSRVAIIPFKGPSIQARTAEQMSAFSSLKGLKKEASRSISYFIALGKKYHQKGAFEVDAYEQRLSDILPNCGGRTLKGYANLIWFTEEVGELVGKNKDDVWEIIKSNALKLDKLQKKVDSFDDTHGEVLSADYWKNVGANIVELVNKLDCSEQVRAFLQLGKCSGQDSLSLAVDVAYRLMEKKGITPKFTSEDIKDSISLHQCGSKGQSRRFFKLQDNKWCGEIISLKAPVIFLSVFPEDIKQVLIKSVSQNESTPSPSSSPTENHPLPTPDENASSPPPLNLSPNQSTSSQSATLSEDTQNDKRRKRTGTPTCDTTDRSQGRKKKRRVDALLDSLHEGVLETPRSRNRRKN